MTIFITCATTEEIRPFLSIDKEVNISSGSFLKSARSTQEKQIYIAISGVGMVNTAFHLTEGIRDVKPDLCLNVGIAGAFNRDIRIGDVVKVKDECFADMGAEDGDNFLGVEEMGFGEQHVYANEFNLLSSPLMKDMRTVKAVSVNTVHGNNASIERCIKKYSPDIESMEGAAFMMICQRKKIPHLQIRSISNYVERRNRESWNIPLAIKNLNDVLNNLIPAL